MPIARAGEIGLHYLERGSGKPLLLIAGIPAVADDWDALAAPLAQSRRVIAYDNRGSGGSTVTPGPYSTGQLAGDAVALLDSLQIEQADVFGMSMGGMIAQELALGWPQRVRRLVLGCTHAGVAHAAPPPREAGRAFAMQTDDWSERIRALAPLAFAHGVDPELLSAFVTKKSADVQDPAGYAAQIQAVLAHNTAERLGDIARPTLILTGDDDRVIPAASSELLRERIPGARLETIAGSGHLFFIEQPERTRRLIEDFLDGAAP
jgi:pimeloyl-ACP methyl ester carboxylesterase